MNFDLHDLILGSLAAVGLGDAMGAATEQWCTEEIYAKHGGPIRICTAHSREAFEGDREVLVGMADPVRLADCAPTIKVS